MDTFKPTGQTVTLPVPGTVTTVTLPVARLVNLFDHRQICPRVLRHLMGDAEPQFTFPDCDAFCQDSGICTRGETDAGLHQCAFLVAHNDPDDDIWERARDWRLIQTPVYDRNGVPIDGLTCDAALWAPKSTAYEED